MRTAHNARNVRRSVTRSVRADPTNGDATSKHERMFHVKHSTGACRERGRAIAQILRASRRHECAPFARARECSVDEAFRCRQSRTPVRAPQPKRNEGGSSSALALHTILPFSPSSLTPQGRFARPWNCSCRHGRYRSRPSTHRAAALRRSSRQRHRRPPFG